MEREPRDEENLNLRQELTEILKVLLRVRCHRWSEIVGIFNRIGPHRRPTPTFLRQKIHIWARI